MNKLKEFYLSEWRFFRKKLLPLFLLVCVFFAGLVITFFLLNKGDTGQIKQYVEDSLLPRLSFASEKSSGFLFLFIFLKNYFTATLTLLIGNIPVFFLPLFVLICNASVMGIHIALFAEIIPTDYFPRFLVYYSPHAIIEIPIMLYAVSLGLLLCFQRSRRILKKKQMQETVFGQQVVIGSEHDLNLPRLTRIFMLIVAPLVLLAAFIEAFITPLIAGLFA